MTGVAGSLPRRRQPLIIAGGDTAKSEAGSPRGRRQLTRRALVTALSAAACLSLRALVQRSQQMLGQGGAVGLVLPEPQPAGAHLRTVLNSGPMCMAPGLGTLLGNLPLPQIKADLGWRHLLPLLKEAGGPLPPSWYTTVDLIRDPSTAHLLRKSQEVTAAQLGPTVRPVDAIAFKVVKHPVRPVRSRDRVVLFSMYSIGGALAPEVHYLLASLMAQRDEIYGVMAVDRPLAEVRVTKATLALFSGLVVRENHGLDFSGFAHLLRIFPDLWDSHQLTFCNDSNFGPLRQSHMQRLFKRIDRSTSAFVGLTESLEGPYNTTKRHFQSFFYTLKRPAIVHSSVQKFWLEYVHSHEDKVAIISRYELGMTSMMCGLGFNIEALFSLPQVAERQNPSLAFANVLIRNGYPFLKKVLFNIPSLAEELARVDLQALESTYPFNLTAHVGQGHLPLQAT